MFSENQLFVTPTRAKRQKASREGRFYLEALLFFPTLFCLMQPSGRGLSSLNHLVRSCTIISAQLETRKA